MLKSDIRKLETRAALADLLGDAWYAWLVMIAVGIIRAEWLTPASEITLPTIGYWWALLLAFLLRTAHNLYAAKAGIRAAELIRGKAI